MRKGDYVDLLINGQVIGIERVDSIETITYYGIERVNAGYAMVLIKVGLLLECTRTSMFIAKGMIVNVQGDEEVKGERLGEIEVGVFME